MGHATLDITTPASWKATYLWAARGRFAFCLVFAFSPTVLSVGVEVIAGEAKGLSLMIGPFWIGLAAIRLTPTQPNEE